MTLSEKRAMWEDGGEQEFVVVHNFDGYKTVYVVVKYPHMTIYRLHRYFLIGENWVPDTRLQAIADAWNEVPESEKAMQRSGWYTPKLAALLDALEGTDDVVSRYRFVHLQAIKDRPHTWVFHRRMSPTNGIECCLTEVQAELGGTDDE